MFKKLCDKNLQLHIFLTYGLVIVYIPADFAKVILFISKISLFCRIMHVIAEVSFQVDCTSSS